MADDRWSALSEAFRAFAHTTQDYSELVETIARKLCELVGDACIVSLAAEGSGLPAFAASAHDPATSSRLRSALATRELDPSSVAAAHLDIRSVISLPLEVPGRRLGEVSLFRYLPDSPAFTDDDLTFARTIADHAAITIVNAELIAELQRAQSRSSTFVSLIENSNEMIGFCDLEGNVKFINRAGRELLGIDDDDQKEYTLRDTIYSEEGVQRVLKIGEINSYRGEGQMRHQKTGEPIATMVSTFIVRDRDGAPTAIATVQRDLRETKRLEEELRQAQKMEALGRLAGGVAHDFNNLLTVILSYCSILTKQLPRGSRQVQDIEQIDRAAQRAAELTKQLLAFSRRQVLELRPLELGATVRAMDGMIRRLIGEDIELRILTMPDEDYVLTDPGQVEQVVMNLAVNARDAMKGGGTLTLETTRSGDYMMLEVRDTGVGIAAETRPHLFEPFFTTKEAGKGTGLGLSTVMGIVQQSGGRVTVDSTVGHGSTFRVFL
ncbi:MAG TPA: ATP-binding protein, partial [Kofleriaceae bacterium]